MRRLTIPALAVLVLILDWAAADDIDHLVLVQRTLDMTKTLMAVLAPLAVIFSWPLWLGIFVEVCSDPRGCN
jgi:hypothetical protein